MPVKTYLGRRWKGALTVSWRELRCFHYLQDGETSCCDCSKGTCAKSIPNAAKRKEVRQGDQTEER
jgi:hypothetical protein